MLIGRDTRISGPTLSEAVAAGARAMGAFAHVISNPVTTPELHWRVARSNNLQVGSALYNAKPFLSHHYPNRRQGCW